MIAEQLAPVASQRFHWYAKLVVVPLHVPVVDVRVEPTAAVPEIVGSTVLVGPVPAARTTAVCAEAADDEPSAFAATTVIRIVLPTSAVWSWYVCAIAPAIGLQLLPAVSQRLQA